MQDILSQTYYSNSLQTWLYALTTIVLSVLLGKVIYWLFSKFIHLFTANTKTQLDDIVVDKVEEPAVFMVVIMGIWVALKMLVLPEVVSNVIANAYQVIIALLVGWLLSRLFDALYRQYLQTSHLKLMTGLKSQVTMAWSSK